MKSSNGMALRRDQVRVRIIHPADPKGTIPGGIDTFIRGIIDWAPDDIAFSLVGITTDNAARPVGTWTSLELNRNNFDFLPVYALENAGRQARVPVSLQFTLRLFLQKEHSGFDVLESHRIEPFLPYLFDKTPKNIFLHNNMDVISDRNSDIRWKHFPWLYRKTEDLLLRRIESVFVVRQDAVEAYRKRYPQFAHRFNFIPTWMDPVTFSPASGEQRASLRRDILGAHGISQDDVVILYVGRLDQQKDPLLLIDSFEQVVREQPTTHLLLVGDGVLREEVETRVKELRLESRVSLAGLMGAKDVAGYLRTADMFVLSSAYEGMPMSVLEALGTGLPVASTDVGEIRRIVKPGVNGEICSTRQSADLAAAILRCIDSLARYSGKPCTSAAEQYVPARVLEPVYENYRRLAHGRSAL